MMDDQEELKEGDEENWESDSDDEDSDDSDDSDDGPSKHKKKNKTLNVKKNSVAKSKKFIEAEKKRHFFSDL